MCTFGGQSHCPVHSLLIVTRIPDACKAAVNLVHLRNSCVILPWDADCLVSPLQGLHKSTTAMHASGQTAEQSAVFWASMTICD